MSPDPSAIGTGLTTQGMAYVAGCVVVALVFIFGLWVRSTQGRLSDVRSERDGLRLELAKVRDQKDALQERVLLATERLLAVQSAVEKRARTRPREEPNAAG